MTEILDSILRSVKKGVNIPDDYDAFDADILININSAFMTLNQLGVGPKDGYVVTGEDETWEDFIGKTKLLESVKLFTILSVRLAFDPPTSSYVTTSYENQIKELSWRIMEQVEERRRQDGRKKHT